ncbi:TIGR02677 family protein [Embleya sp. NBC_00896]|uniref:TIGR02677 family protein n=1 Tax=Embleya sp. NBC_00896 TaxID=2975961 RepID=UPI003867F833|nr:TIGR02677 family protein [Embleya sp. NBC_00896]
MARGNQGDGREARDRLVAYSYLSAPERDDYLAIVRLFGSSLMADLSAHEVAERLGRTDVETVTARLDALVGWGNLIRSTHRVRAASIAEFQRARSRYQISNLGERIQRDVDDVLTWADAAREVAAELLALVDRELAGLTRGVAAPGGVDPEQARDAVATLFVQFGEFADSVRDFYAYLGQVLARYDLDGDEYRGFKELLLDYVEAIREDVAFHTPRIRDSLDTLAPYLTDLLGRIDDLGGGLAGLEEVTGSRVQRSRGRELADWAALRAWFVDVDGQGSQVDQLRAATMRALGSLLANAKRMIRSTTSGQSRRGDLIRLAAWFDGCDDTTAHDLYAAAFGLYGARHLGVVGDLDVAIPAGTSWWEGPVAEVPVALRERGERSQRGRAASVEDHSAQKAQLMARAEAEATARADAAAELRAVAAQLDRARLSTAAKALFEELFTGALNSVSGDLAALDGARRDLDELDIALGLRVDPAARTLVRSAEGDFEIDGLRVLLGRAGSEWDLDAVRESR